MCAEMETQHLKYNTSKTINPTTPPKKKENCIGGSRAHVAMHVLSTYLSLRHRDVNPVVLEGRVFGGVRLRAANGEARVAAVRTDWVLLVPPDLPCSGVCRACVGCILGGGVEVC